MTTATLEKRVTKTESNLEKLEQLIFRLGVRVDELTIRMEESRVNQQQGFAELRESQNATNKRMEQGFAELRENQEQGFAELRASQDGTNKRMEQGFAELRASQDDTNKRMEQGFAEFRESQEQGFAELRASQNDTNKRMEQGFAEFRKSQKELNKKWGELSNRLGTIVEDLVAPSLERIFFEVTGLSSNSEILMNVRVKRRHIVTRKIREFDAIVESEKYLLVNETKSKLIPEDIPKFLVALTEFYNYFPDYKNKELMIIGAMSSLHLDQSLITALSKQGLLALAIGDAITTLKSPEGFAWKVF